MPSSVVDVQAPAPVRFRDFTGLIRLRLKSGQIWTRCWPGGRGPPANATHWWDGSTWREDFGGYWRPVADGKKRQRQVWEWE